MVADEKQLNTLFLLFAHLRAMAMFPRAISWCRENCLMSAAAYSKGRTKLGIRFPIKNAYLIRSDKIHMDSR